MLVTEKQRKTREWVEVPVGIVIVIAFCLIAAGCANQKNFKFKYEYLENNTQRVKEAEYFYDNSFSPKWSTDKTLFHFQIMKKEIDEKSLEDRESGIGTEEVELSEREFKHEREEG